MRKASLYLGAALAAASLALAGPANATAPAPGTVDAAATASAAPGCLGGGMPSSVIHIQDPDASIDGARVGVSTADGYYDHSLATDGTVRPSAIFKPAE